MHELIDLLQRKQWVWQGTAQLEPLERYGTGYPLLDEKLLGGFPRDSLIEIRSATGIGELRLLHPLMREQSGLKVFISPPACLNAAYFHHSQIDTDTVLVITPPSVSDGLWAAEQCLQSGHCAQVLLWQQQLSLHQVKRLQLACEKGRSLQFVFRQPHQQLTALPVALSLELRAHELGVATRITKHRGGWPSREFVLEMGEFWADLQQTPAESGNILPFPIHRVG